MIVTQANEGRALAWLTKQELDLLLNCAFEVRESLSDGSVFKDRIGYEDEEVLALMKQMEQAIEMIERGTEPGAFGCLRPRGAAKAE